MSISTSSQRYISYLHLRSTRTIVSWLTCVALMFSSPHVAEAGEWGYQVTQQVEPGKQATFTLSPGFTLKKAQLVMSSGSKTIKRRFKLLKASTPYRVKFKPPKGESTWSAELSGLTTDGQTYSVSFEFTVLSAKALQAQVIMSESSLEAGRVMVASNNPLDHAELEAYGDEGEQLWVDHVTFKPVSKSKGRYLAQYDRSPAPRRLDVKIFDAYESWVGIRLVRWYADIPHADVLFESSSSELKRSEEGKMSDAISAVAKELLRYRRAIGDSSAQVDLQLYVGGYTDSVGSARDNMKLSEARARSIATYFKKNRVEIPIFYAGFGEQAPLVQTPDQTDEPRNRRALYIVANFPPTGEGFPNARWRRLP